MTNLKELAISITGKITSSNFAEFKGALLDVIGKTNRVLGTDDDFDQATADIESLKDYETALTQAKRKAIESVPDIYQLFGDIDEVSAEARQARLDLKKQIDKRRVELKREIVGHGITQVVDYLGQMHPDLVTREGESIESNAAKAIEEATKNRRKYDKMREAVDAVVAGIIEKLEKRNRLVSSNMDLLEAYSEKYGAILKDKVSLACTLTADELKATVQKRIEEYEQQKTDELAAAQARKQRQQKHQGVTAARAQEAPPMQEVTAHQALAQTPAPARELPQVASVVASNLDGEPPKEIYQITILLSAKNTEAVSLARTIKEKYGAAIDDIKLHQLDAEQAA